MSQWDPAQVTALRAGVYNADGSVVGVVRGRLTEQVLQLAGDGLLDALAQGVEGAVDLAAQCAAGLRERCWDGDEELADQLQAALGWGATPLLRSLRVDLEELASLLEGDPLCGGGRIDLRSGVCWPYGVGYGEDDEDDDDEDRWLHVASLGSREGYRDMTVHSQSGRSRNRRPSADCDHEERPLPSVQRRALTLAPGSTAVLPVIE